MAIDSSDEEDIILEELSLDEQQPESPIPLDILTQTQVIYNSKLSPSFAIRCINADVAYYRFIAKIDALTRDKIGGLSLEEWTRATKQYRWFWGTERQAQGKQAAYNDLKLHADYHALQMKARGSTSKKNGLSNMVLRIIATVSLVSQQETQLATRDNDDSLPTEEQGVWCLFYLINYRLRTLMNEGNSRPCAIILCPSIRKLCDNDGHVISMADVVIFFQIIPNTSSLQLMILEIGQLQ